LAIALVALMLYSYRTGPYLETYYAAAVRSMAMSWHNFFFGSFDPAGTVTLDKLPGAFWIQALSVRLLGVHAWAFVLPQILEGVASVLVLYRIVRRLVGPMPGVMAAGLLALSPANVALDRGNIADALMILCLLLAVDAILSSAQKSSRWHAVLAGVWVGCAFQAKMLEAWLVVPAPWLLLFCVSKESWRTVLLKLSAFSAIALLVSISWMSVVSLFPASSRPYVDGSSNNSEFHQVFVYNGVDRVGVLSPNQVLDQTVGLRLPAPPPASWDRLLRGSLGRDGGWLLPAAVFTLLAGLIGTRRSARGDPWRSSFVLWGTWLVFLGLLFSVGSSLNTYYLAALSPAVAGLLATGAAMTWARRNSAMVGVAAVAVLTLTAVYGALLVPTSGTGVGPWIAPLAVALASAVAGGVIVSWWRSNGQLVAMLGAGVACSLVILPTIASFSFVLKGLGAFDTPFEPVTTASAVRYLLGTSATEGDLVTLEAAQNGAPYLMATQSSALAAPFIYESGLEVLPIGGFTGVNPSPSLNRIRGFIDEGKFHLVLASPSTRDPRFTWISAHCSTLPTPSASNGQVVLPLSIYYCTPSN
jgi:4-amino-4-deoxy-L-arabinose transferase-like glycosyltransferase